MNTENKEFFKIFKERLAKKQPEISKEDKEKFKTMFKSLREKVAELKSAELETESKEIK